MENILLVDPTVESSETQKIQNSKRKNNRKKKKKSGEESGEERESDELLKTDVERARRKARKR